MLADVCFSVSLRVKAVASAVHMRFRWKAFGLWSTSISTGADPAVVVNGKYPSRYTPSLHRPTPLRRMPRIGNFAKCSRKDVVLQEDFL